MRVAHPQSFLFKRQKPKSQPWSLKKPSQIGGAAWFTLWEVQPVKEPVCLQLTLKPVASANTTILPWDAGWFGRCTADVHARRQHRPKEPVGASWAWAQFQAEVGNCYESLTENGKGEALGALGGHVAQVWLKASSLRDRDSILLCLRGLWWWKSKIWIKV